MQLSLESHHAGLMFYPRSKIFSLLFFAQSLGRDKVGQFFDKENE
jgi:hypothetical protein